MHKAGTRFLAAVALVACAPAVRLPVQAPATFPGEPGGYESARVIDTVDGDTIVVAITGRVEGPGAGDAVVGREYRLRMIGIDTPESVAPGAPVECFGIEASKATKALLEGESVRLVTDVSEVDRYDRLLRYVYLGDEMANARLVLNGYAAAYTYPPDVRHADLFVALQARARAEGRGLWSRRTCGGRA